MTCYLAASSIQRDVGAIATEHPALWREIRRFNLPVKLALAAAQHVIGAVARPRHARLIALAPCRPGSPELRSISRELDAGFARGSCDKLRVNPIYTLHAIDNLALSALSIRLENHEPCVCLGGAAGQVFVGLEQAIDELAAGATDEVLLFGGDQSDASWRGEPIDRDACGVAIVLASRPHRLRLVSIDRTRLASDAPVAPHAVAGLAGWLEAIATAPVGTHRHVVPAADGDGVDRIELVVEVA